MSECLCAHTKSPVPHSPFFFCNPRSISQHREYNSPRRKPKLHPGPREPNTLQHRRGRGSRLRIAGTSTLPALAQTLTSQASRSRTGRCPSQPWRARTTERRRVGEAPLLGDRHPRRPARKTEIQVGPTDPSILDPRKSRAPRRGPGDPRRRRGSTPTPNHQPPASPPPRRRRPDPYHDLHYIQARIRGSPTLPPPERPPEEERTQGSQASEVV